MIYSRHQIIKENLEVESSEAFLKGETPLGDYHPIHPSMQAHFMVIAMHVLTLDIELETTRIIAGVLIKGFIKALNGDFLEDKTESHMPLTTEVTTPLLHYSDQMYSATCVIILAILHEIVEVT